MAAMTATWSFIRSHKATRTVLGICQQLAQRFNAGHLLREVGATTKLSRITNTEDDDRYLSAIVAEANAFNADFMLSIHTNAGVTNYILQLYSGWDASDTHTYPGVITPETAKGSRY